MVRPCLENGRRKITQNSNEVDAETKECTRKTEKKNWMEGIRKDMNEKITQNSIEVDAETKECTRKTEENLDGRYKEGHERKKPK